MTKHSPDKWSITIELYPIIRDAFPMTMNTVIAIFQHESVDSFVKAFESQMIQRFGRSHSIRNPVAKRLSE